RGPRDPRRQLLERAERHELRHPRVAELRRVRRRLAHERGEQLLVRRRPRDLLYTHADARMPPLELRHQPPHDLAFPADAPEQHLHRARGPCVAAGGEERAGCDGREGAERRRAAGAADAPRHRRRGAPHDARITSRVGSTSCRRTCWSFSSIASTSRPTARLPSSAIATCTDDGGGLTYAAIGTSSNPAAATSSGTTSPASRSRLTAPIAIESFAAKTAVGRGASSRNRS